jgi:hypothetical protein
MSQCVEDHFKATNSVYVAIAICCLCGSTEAQFNQLLHLAKFFDAVVAEAAVF